MTRPEPPFEIGDRVAISARYLRATGDYSQTSADMRGTITDFPYFSFRSGLKLASVKWDGRERPMVFNTVNLVHAHRIHLEPN